VTATVQSAQDGAQVHRLLDHVEVVVELETLPVHRLVERVGVGQLAYLLDDILGLCERIIRTQRPARHGREERLEIALERGGGVVDIGALLVVQLRVLPNEAHICREFRRRRILSGAQLLLRASNRPAGAPPHAGGRGRASWRQRACRRHTRARARDRTHASRRRSARRMPAAGEPSLAARALTVPRSIGCLTTLG